MRGFVKVVAWYDNEWGYSCRVPFDGLAERMPKIFQGARWGIVPFPANHAYRRKGSFPLEEEDIGEQEISS